MNEILEPKVEVNSRNIIITDENNDIYVEVNLPKKGKYFNVYVSTFDTNSVKFHVVFDNNLNVRAIDYNK